MKDFWHSVFIKRKKGNPRGFIYLNAVVFLLAVVSLNAVFAEKKKPNIKLESYPLENVHLLDSPFRDAMIRDSKYLIELDMDRLLAPFYIEAGLEPKAPKYGGWESSDLKGHTLGHYLSAVSLMYAATHDDRFLKRANYIVDELAYVQQKNGDGYLGGIPDRKKFWNSVIHDSLDTKNFDLNGVWSPWYNLHKTYAGLRDAYLYADNQKAKSVLIKYADWAVNLSSQMSDERFTKMLNTEYGGMNEVMADIYEITGDQKYMDLARRFNQQKLFRPLASHKDVLQGLHSNTQIPKLIGAAREYELTGDEELAEAAKFFWKEVALKRSYVIGGNSYNEYFGPKGHLSKRLGRETAETCNTYNMLKLTKHLMEWDPNSTYADFYERALYNHILASQDSRKGMFTYLMSLDQGGFKTFSNPFDSFWCCVGTGMENHAKYGTNIYLHNDNELYLNLFIPSELNWEKQGLKLRQETKFPETGETHLKLSLDKSKKFTLKVRRPYWAGEGFEIKVDGHPVKTDMSEGYAGVSRKWKDGDSVDITLPMSLHLEYMPDDSSKAAIMYGPIVLAGELGKKWFFEPMPYASSRTEYFDVPSVKVPSLKVSNNKQVGEWVKPVGDKPLHFKTVGVGDPEDVTLAPFYKIDDQHYTVYWDLKSD